MEANLLGPHAQIVERIVGYIAAIRAGKQAPRVVLLRGPAGVGKSRIIREVYERLRVEGEEPHYWAPLLAGAPGVLTDPMRLRKRLAPELETARWPARSLPEFGWWTVQCGEDAAGYTASLHDSLERQWRLHVSAVAIAKAKSRGKLDRFGGRLWRLIESVRDAVVTDGADLLIEAALAALNITIPLFGTAVDAVFGAAKAGKHAADQRGDWLADIDLGDRHRTAETQYGAGLAASLREVASPAVPGIIAAEDLHLMGGDAVRFFGEIAQHDAQRPLLLLGTVWPEGEARPAYRQWRRGLAADEVDIIDVPALSEQDLGTLVHARAPQTEPGVARRIGARLGTPLAVGLWLGLGSTEDLIEDNGGRLRESDETSIPSSLIELYRRRWDELGEAVRGALLVAAALDPRDAFTGEFPVDVVQHVLVEMLGAPPHDAAEALRASVEAAGWCRRRDGRQWYVEPALADLVRDLARERFGRQRRERFRDAARGVIRERLDSQIDELELPTDAATQLMARWYIELTGGFDVAGDADDGVRAAALWAFAREAAHHRRTDVAALAADRVLPFLLALLDVDEPFAAQKFRQAAHWLGDSGQPDDAVQRLRALHGLLALRRGEEHAETLIVAADICFFLAEAGRFELAIQQMDALLPRLEKHFGEHSEQVFDARVSRLQWLWAIRPGPEIIEVAAVGLGDVLRHLPETHTLRLQLQALMAGWAMELRSTNIAGQLLESLLRDQTAILGSGAPATFVTRSQIALLERLRGRFSEEEAAQAALVAEAHERFGALHETTLDLRREHARAVFFAGRQEEAMTLYDDLLADAIHRYDHDHITVLRMREDHNVFRARFGDISGACAAAEVLLADAQGVLDHSHPLLADVRRQLAALRAGHEPD